MKEYIKEFLKTLNIEELRPAQKKAIDAGLLEGKNILVCTPTASGKTLVAQMAALESIESRRGRAVYIVPLKALATEKYKQFKKDFGDKYKISLSIGDLDSNDGYLAHSDIIICTAEKLDSLTRHHAPWLNTIGCIIVDEIHLLNDPSRGPTLEVLLIMLKQIVPHAQVIGLSATVGNEQALAQWLEATLVQDTWRPVELKKGIYRDGEVTFY
ncbi:DEAD/DEAH box helicase [Candidatus Woesearchaeota archaeon]|nr:MAG: DEAD/DEAH box helicase [Candidatus Woesearchaeota archaeon]